jgi:hypothetical protein
MTDGAAKLTGKTMIYLLNAMIFVEMEYSLPMLIMLMNAILKVFLMDAVQTAKSTKVGTVLEKDQAQQTCMKQLIATKFVEISTIS